MNDKNKDEKNVSSAEGYSLNDDRRVKVLSPTMLVMKRFVRNKLAIVGTIIIAFMFLFSFAGPLVYPYTEDQVFRKYEVTWREYANAASTFELRFTNADGRTLSNSGRAAVRSAVASGESVFEAGTATYYIETLADGLYRVSEQAQLANFNQITKELTSVVSGFTVPDGLIDALADAAAAGQNELEFEGDTYELARSGKFYSVTSTYEVALASFNTVLTYDSGATIPYDMQITLLEAALSGDSSFSFDGADYTVGTDEFNNVQILLGGEPFALLVTTNVQLISTDSFLSAPFASAVDNAIQTGSSEFTLDDVDYKISGTDGSYKITAEAETQIIDTYAYPSAEHWLGTDSNGMDIMIRLMYGGRISLMIGFIVVFIEVIIGVVLGGIAGYFGGWIDNLLMRVVDVFNCIPTLPLFIIIGTVLDDMNVDAQMRIYYLMLVLGIFSWPGIARLVRGQILSLREQEFMIATEATGLSISRRIFRHLIPNVIPQLIVMATMGLGSIILTESTLSFFGLGVKHPYASWGNIINAVNNIHVMTNYLFVWIPAGLLILLTVLGFNFVGDGLRDAFDPKMKR